MALAGPALTPDGALASTGLVHGREFDGDPGSGGSLIVEEWGVPGRVIGRQERKDQVTTLDEVPCPPPRSSQRCIEQRTATRWSASDPGSTEVYEVQTWAEDDPAIERVLSITSPAPGTVTAAGPIADAVESWQVLPPGHGAGYQRYERTFDNADTGERVHASVWVDAVTKLPLRFASGDPNAQDPAAAYWTYEPETVPRDRLPADFLAVARPSNTASDTTAQSIVTLPLGPETDTESGRVFLPASLGPRPDLDGRSLCFAGGQSIRSFDSTPRDDFENPDPELAPDPYGPLTWVDAGYGPPQPDGRCELAGNNTPLSVSVRSIRAGSSMARAYHAGYGRTGNPVTVVVSDSGALLAPTLPPPIGGRVVTVHVVDDDEGHVSALLDPGDDLTVELTGDITRDDLPALTSLLVSSR